MVYTQVIAYVFSVYWVCCAFWYVFPSVSEVSTSWNFSSTHSISGRVCLWLGCWRSCKPSMTISHSSSRNFWTWESGHRPNCRKQQEPYENLGWVTKESFVHSFIQKEPKINLFPKHSADPVAEGLAGQSGGEYVAGQFTQRAAHMHLLLSWQNEWKYGRGNRKNMLRWAQNHSFLEKGTPVDVRGHTKEAELGF